MRLSALEQHGLPMTTRPTLGDLRELMGVMDEMTEGANDTNPGYYYCAPSKGRGDAIMENNGQRRHRWTDSSEAELIDSRLFLDRDVSLEDALSVLNVSRHEATTHRDR